MDQNEIKPEPRRSTGIIGLRGIDVTIAEPFVANDDGDMTTLMMSITRMTKTTHPMVVLNGSGVQDN